MIRVNMADMQDCLGCSQPAPEMDAVHYIGYQPASQRQDRGSTFHMRPANTHLQADPDMVSKK
jgi:hypothetical protein